jgi:hypothetical protein
MALQEIVYIAQEAAGKHPPLIEHREFKNALIEGPAVLAPLEQVDFVNNTFDGTIDSLFIEIPEGRNVQGVIGLRHVKFIGCEFRGIALAGTPETIAEFREQMSGGIQT